MSAKPLNVGMIGYGFMGRAHSNAYRRSTTFFDLPYRPVLKAVCARNADKAKAFADKWGYESVETDWREAGRAQGHRPDRHLHAEQHARRDRHRRRQGRQDDPVREAAGDERPPKARRWSRRSRRPSVPNMVWYNYRRVPAVTLAKQLIDEGRLGRIFHYRAKFLQDWTI